MEIIERLTEIAFRSAESTAVIDNGTPVSFAGLERRVRRLAGWLHKEGQHPHDTVGLSVRGEFHHLVASLALLRLGCSQVTLASHEPEAMRDALARRCGVDCVICEDPGLRLPGTGALVPDFEDIFADASLENEIPPHGEEPLILLSSSGTTGRPKIIPCTQRQISGYASLRMDEPAILYRLTSIESNIGKWSHLSNLSQGRTLVFCNPDSMPLVEICRTYGVTQVNTNAVKAAALLRGLEGSERPPLAGVRLVLGGSPVPGSLRQEILNRLTERLYVMYGATECGLATSAGPQTHVPHPDGVGRPLPGVEVEIVDASGTTLPTGEEGEIRIRSRFSASCYYDDAEASARAFKGGWFHPGDRGRMTSDGTLVFAGRGDDMMILNTINIFPAEIENVAETFPGVLSCAAFPIRSRAFGDIPVLAVVAGHGFDPDGLLSFCRDRLGTRSPRKIFQVESIPRNDMGKVLRRELQTRLGGNT